MTVTVRHGNLGSATTDITGSVRLPGGDAIAWQLEEQAEKGAASLSGLNVEDPGASISLIGLKEVHAEDTACTEPTIFAGFWETRKGSRGQALRTGTDRAWDAGVTDLNVLLGDYIILSGNRPAETDIVRIDWLLGSGYCPIGDAGFIDRASPTSLPAADYTGRTASDVMAECSNLSNKNYFVRWEQQAFFPDPASPWATIGTSLSSSRAVADGVVEDDMIDLNAPLANGERRAVVITGVGDGIRHGKSYWLDRVVGSAPPASPWLDPTGTRTSDTVTTNRGEGAFSMSLGVLTMDSPAVGDEGWHLISDTDGYADPPYWGRTTGWSYGWLFNAYFGGLNYPINTDRYDMTITLYPPGPGPALCYHETNWSGDVAGISISNVLSEVNGSTVFAPSFDAPLERDPSRVYSGCWFEFNGGHVYVPNATTLANFRHRDVRASDLNCGKATSATALATAYLARVQTEEDRLNGLVLHNVPAASVNLARPGQRIGVKMTHLGAPYTSGTTMGIVHRTVSPVAYGLYDVTLDLAVPKLTGFSPADTLHPSLYSQNIGQVTQPAIVPASAVMGQTVPPTVVGTGDGVTVLFTLLTGYISGSVRVWVDEIPVPQASITETDPAAGTITLDFAPADASGSAPAETISASWQVA